MATHSKEPKNSAPATFNEEPSCSYTTARCSSREVDVRIQSKINDLNQTFVRIINSLKIINVHNRNSRRESLNSNGEMLSLFDDFLNISHLLNIKINYLYNTYVSRSEMRKYISSINYKLYVFNINSFELSQEIDKGNRKHKKYQILHDLNISEMTNNVKLFNFVDDVDVEPDDAKLEETALKETNANSSEEEIEIKDNNELGKHSKKLKRKTNRQSTTECNSPSEDSDSSSSLDKKKMKTNEDLEDNSDSVDMYNNLFKEINNNILELSKDIDELTTLLRTQTQTLRRPVSPGSSNEEEEETGDETGKKQTSVDKKLRKWQMKQMTRSLIENMVNSIQEEYMSRLEARSERSLVNEAVLMAIQRIGLQREEEEADSSLNSTPGANSSVSSPQEALGSSRTSDSLVMRGIRESLGHVDDDESPCCSTDGGSSSTESTRVSDNDLLRQDHSVGRKLIMGEKKTDANEEKRSKELDEAEESHGSKSSHELEKDSLKSSELNLYHDQRAENVPSGTDKSTVHCSTVSEPSGEQSISSEHAPISDQYCDDDFLTQAVSVAISKKGLST